MKKSNFIAMILGTVSGLLFALGMCMALLPEWNAFKIGVVCTAIGANSAATDAAYTSETVFDAPNGRKLYAIWAER